MTSAQIQVFTRRLTRMGYSTELSGSLTARSKKGSIHLDSRGVCWSTLDPADAILPAIPDILASRRERVPLTLLKSMYFRLGGSRGRITMRISARIESYSLWDKLRASDGCALAPDEHAIASFLIRRATECKMLTDFPTDESTVTVCGRRRYYDSKLDSARAAETLRVAGSKASRNSYLRRDGLLELDGFTRPSAKDCGRAFDELGEWCYFAPG